MNRSNRRGGGSPPIRIARNPTVWGANLRGARLLFQSLPISGRGGRELGSPTSPDHRAERHKGGSPASPCHKEPEVLTSKEESWLWIAVWGLRHSPLVRISRCLTPSWLAFADDSPGCLSPWACREPGGKRWLWESQRVPVGLSTCLKVPL